MMWAWRVKSIARSINVRGPSIGISKTPTRPGAAIGTGRRDEWQRRPGSALRRSHAASNRVCEMERRRNSRSAPPRLIPSLASRLRRRGQPRAGGRPDNASSTNLRRQGLKRVFVLSRSMVSDLTCRRGATLEQASIFIGMDDPDTDEMFARMHKISVERTTATESGGCSFAEHSTRCGSSVGRACSDSPPKRVISFEERDAVRSSPGHSSSLTQLSSARSPTCGDARGGTRLLACREARARYRRTRQAHDPCVCSPARVRTNDRAAHLRVKRGLFCSVWSERFKRCLESLEGLDWHLACALLRALCRSSQPSRPSRRPLSDRGEDVHALRACDIAAGEVRDFVDHGMDIAMPSRSSNQTSSGSVWRLRAHEMLPSQLTTYVGHVSTSDPRRSHRRSPTDRRSGATRSDRGVRSCRFQARSHSVAAERVVAAPEGGVRIETASTTRAPKYRLSVAVPDAAGAADAESDAVFQLAAELVIRFGLGACRRIPARGSAGSRADRDSHEATANGARDRNRAGSRSMVEEVRRTARGSPRQSDDRTGLGQRPSTAEPRGRTPCR
jgi:hypothetical protein